VFAADSAAALVNALVAAFVVELVVAFTKNRVSAETRRHSLDFFNESVEIHYLPSQTLQLFRLTDFKQLGSHCPLDFSCYR
jgi:hypothetical protein